MMGGITREQILLNPGGTKLITLYGATQTETGFLAGKVGRDIIATSIVSSLVDSVIVLGVLCLKSFVALLPIVTVSTLWQNCGRADGQNRQNETNARSDNPSTQQAQSVPDGPIVVHEPGQASAERLRTTSSHVPADESIRLVEEGRAWDTDRASVRPS